MLWDLIRDFFVQHVFGGYLSNGGYAEPVIGELYNIQNDEYMSVTSDSLLFPLTEQYSITIGDWLSTTATAISITIIVVLCCMFVYKIVKLIGGLIR